MGEKEKTGKTGLIVLIAVIFTLGFLIAIIADSHLTLNPKIGEEYHILSITEPQTQKGDVWIGLANQNIDNQVIITLRTQSKERIVFSFNDKSKIPVNLNKSDIIVFTKNGNIVIK